MKAINSVLEQFNNGAPFQTEENFNFFKIKFTTKSLNIPLEKEFNKVLKNLEDIEDLISIDIQLEEDDPVTFHLNSDITSFLQEVKTLIGLNAEEDNFQVKLQINKKIVDNRLAVYSFDHFVNYMVSQSLKGILYNFNNFTWDTSPVMFKVFDDAFENDFYTNNIFFLKNKKDIAAPLNVTSRTEIIEKRNRISNFINSTDYKFTPNDFFLLLPSKNQQLDELFEKLSLIFSLVYISDISNINDNSLYFRINGYTTIDQEIYYQSSILNNHKELFQIYSWIYNEGDIFDKSGLARNIVSLHTNNSDTFGFKENIFNSIKSSYDIYLKENVERYIEVKNKLTEFLMDLSVRTNELLKTVSDSIRNNTMLLLTFFVSIFVFNSLSSDKMSKIFTNDITWISYAVLLISLVFLYITKSQTKSDIERIKKQYDRLKNMYTDILDKKDLDNIFKSDALDEDINYIEEKLELYSKFWLTEIVVLAIAIEIIILSY